MDCKVRADGDYPTVEGKGEGGEIFWLMPAYGGRNSETTAIMGYVYQSYIVKEAYPDLSACLEQIAIVEMVHHELLAKSILYFGGTPYIGGNKNFWQGNAVNYAKDPLLFLQNDIAGEKRAIYDYRNIILHARNTSLKELIGRIIQDEEIHIQSLNEWIEKLRCA